MATRRRLKYLPIYSAGIVIVGSLAFVAGTVLDLAVESTGDVAGWPRLLVPVRQHPFLAIAVAGAVLLGLPIINLLYGQLGPQPATTDDLAEMEERIHDRFDSADLARANDDAFLNRLPPYARYLLQNGTDQDDLRQLISPFIDEALDPKRVASEWAAAAPSATADLSGHGHLLIAEILLAYGQAMAALLHFETALSRGVSPRPYWHYRAAQAAWQIDGPESPAAADHLETARTIDPEYRLVKAALLHQQERFAEASAVLAGWTASTVWEQEQATFVLAAALAGQDQVDESILAIEAVAASTENAGLLLRLAHMLRHRSVLGFGDSRWKDAFQAIDLAIRARNLRRTWRGDSADAVQAAAEAAIIADDPEQVWALTRSSPDGEATDGESSDERVMPLAAMGAALTGRTAQAQELADRVPDGLMKWRVEAEIAAAQVVTGNNDRAIAAWKKVLGASERDEDRLHALRALAMEGAFDVRAADDLRARHAAAILDIETIQEVMAVSSLDDDGNLRRLEADTPLASVRRAELLRDAGNPIQAAEVLVDANDRWRNPRLLLMAIDSYMEAGAWEQADSIARQALADGGIWPGRAIVLRRLVNIRATLKNWTSVASACRSLLELDEDDEDARWSLALAEFYGGNAEQAWRTIRRAGAVLPSTSNRAIFLLDLARRFADAKEVARIALTQLQSFPDDELVHAAAIHAVTMRFDRSDLPEDVGRTVTEAWSIFLERYPDSQLIRSYRLGGEDNPLADIEPILRQRAASLQEALSAVRDRLLPVGFLDQVLGKPYAAMLTFRPLGYHRAASAFAGDGALELKNAREATTRECIVDASALYTLSLIPKVGSVLTVMLRRPATTAVGLNDLLAANDHLGLPSAGTLGFDPERGLIFVAEADAEEQARQKSQLQIMLDIARRFRRVTHPALKHFEWQDRSREPVWLLNIDSAKDEQALLWADDLGLRRLANESGVKSFGTLSLIELAREQGKISDDDHRLAMDALVAEYVVDLPFNEERLLTVAQAQNWRPESVAVVLSRAASWVEIDPAVNVIRRVLQEAASDHVGAWAFAALRGLKDASPAPSLYPNLTAITTAFICEKWARPDHTKALFEALRQLVPAEAEDAIRSVLLQVWQNLTNVFGTGDALTVYLYLVSQIDESYRQIAVNIVLNPLKRINASLQASPTPGINQEFATSWIARSRVVDNERDAISLVDELFRNAGATTRRAAGGDDYADMVVWEDSLAETFGLPLVIEVVSTATPRSAAIKNRLNRILESSGSRTLVALTLAERVPPVRWTAGGSIVLFASTYDLTQLLTSMSLAAALERLLAAARPA